ncbi:DUF3299 domain-containing protein [Oxalicibacterium faecigallinarum]|uniref:DUF3299 domain-containing protein n=1 Tax=Oxalicibacterium faecigallinarum TaxID=573741 RepID=A0A8J3AYN9_9BURK|nr:DUF3299 domain-containing protein [Oxalicibacterium faecigallinarum]GGI19836.1 hypothetical protein GCM10008066_21020 [Oxalicibacterium faecigallinarum]
MSLPRRFSLIVCALLSYSATHVALAQSSAEQHANTTTPPPQMPVLKEIPGVTSWNTLAMVKQKKVKNQILPAFAKEVVALDKREIKVQGFMMPLEPGEKQKHFLLSIYPQSCSYCLPAGPEGVVEVNAKTPVKYTFEPVVISGTMEILQDDPMGLYYRMNNAAISK